MTKLATESWMEPSAQTLIEKVRAVGGPWLAHYGNESLIHQVVSSLLLELRDGRARTLDAAAVMKALECADLLQIAEALESSAAEQGAAVAAHDAYRRQVAGFRRRHPAGKPGVVRAVDSLDELLDERTAGDCLLLWRDAHLAPECQRLFADVDWRIGEFIEAQGDLPGINCLVREGLVKWFTLASGRTLVAKRDNPAKPGRFLQEQRNVAALVERLGLIPPGAFVDAGEDGAGRPLRVKIVRPVCVIADRTRPALFSLSLLEPHPTLESLLRSERGGARAALLTAARAVLECLYAHGVIWGDMAPRNILVERHDAATTWHLLDFEKTILTRAPATPAERLEHARGPMCVEEFGAVCSLSEVKDCFRGYFEPEAWDLSDPRPVPFARPKREIVDLLRSARGGAFSYGDYNAAEKEILGVRFPFHGRDGRQRLPLYVSFKVDHYLGAEYDRKTTELLVAGRDANLLGEVVDVLDDILVDLENERLLGQFLGRLGAGAAPRERAPGHRQRLVGAIDALHGGRSDRSALSRTLRQLAFRAQLHRLRSRYMPFPGFGLELARQNWALVETGLAGLSEALARVDGAWVVMLYGGAARREFCFASDLDIGVVAADAGSAAAVAGHVHDWCRANLDVELQTFVPIALQDLGALIASDPEHFLDFAYARALCGSAALRGAAYQAIRAAIGSDLHRKLVRRHYARKYAATQLQPKPLLEQLSVASAFAALAEEHLARREELEQLRGLVLTWKNEVQFAQAGFPGPALVGEAQIRLIAPRIQEIFESTVRL
jgi:hypothetical protein